MRLPVKGDGFEVRAERIGRGKGGEKLGIRTVLRLRGHENDRSMTASLHRSFVQGFKISMGHLAKLLL